MPHIARRFKLPSNSPVSAAGHPTAEPIETPLETYDYDLGMCPQAEKAAKEVVNLPLHRRAGERTVA